ncbi:MAG TPA: penicillin acylase family protein, partial [Candidatus Limnocylindria bacterium]|nr:penicillin acylase family protein [Candidatus Limnocylindria bacterium]
MRSHPRLIALAAVLVLVVGTLATMWGLVFVRPLPTIDGDERLLGLHERAEVLRDTYGVPHIFAANEHDLFYLQGYVTAQDRLWQMDIYRRAASGRLAEVLGEPALESDRFMRTIGLARAAALDRSVASERTLALLQAYADGVNKFLEQHGDSLPVEFLILGYKPARWTVDDSLAIAKLQLYDAAGNYRQELLRAGIATRLGLEVLPALMPDPGGAIAYDRRAWEEVSPHFSGATSVPGAAALGQILGGAGQGYGSNCWALAGSRTKSGKPLLAGDPHLPVRNPSIWYELALSAAELRLIGFSIPGVPGVVIGHNDAVAWSLAYAYADTQDLFVERADPTDLRRFEYQGRYEPATFVRESIAVKGRADAVVQDVAITRHGPVLTPVLEGQTAQLALRWTALDATRTVDAVMGMNRARSWDEFRRAAADFSGAALSACYADTGGHIGYLLIGRLPDRSGDGRMPVAGWTGTNEWRGLLSADANAAVLDPPGGLVLNANERPVTRPDQAGYMGEWDPGFRYRHLASRLGEIRSADLAGMARLQSDYTSPPAQTFRETLRAAKPRTALGQQVQQVTDRWDGGLGVDSAGAAIYEAWLVRFARLAFADKLGDALFDDYATHGRMVFALHELVGRSASPWFTVLADPAITGRDLVAGAALDAAAADLVARLGPEIVKWRWGDLHTISFEHPLSAAKPLDRLFTIGPVRRAGDGYSPNNGAYSLTKPFALRSHASERQIVDLGDIDASVSIIPVGQSGQPFSRHWGDQVRLWADGETKPMALTRERIGQLEGR